MAAVAATDRQAVPPRARQAVAASAAAAPAPVAGSCALAGVLAMRRLRRVARRDADRGTRRAAGRPHDRARARPPVDGEVLALVDGLRGQNILRSDLDDVAASGCCRRPGSRARRSAACCRRRWRSTVHERRPMGIGRIGTALYLIDATRRGHRRVRARLRRPRSADRRRAGGGAPGRRGDRRRARAPSLPAA